MFFPPRYSENMRSVLNYYELSVPKGAKIVIPINISRLNPEVVEFHFKDWQGPVVTTMASELEPQENGVYYLTLELDEESKYQKDVVDDSLFRWNYGLRQREMGG